MALVKATQRFVMEGYVEIDEKMHWWSKPKYVRKLVTNVAFVEVVCDESEVEKIIEEKIKDKMQRSRYYIGRNFEGWNSYRKYFEPGEYDSYPNGFELETEIEYIRDLNMKEIINLLNGKQFAILCKELGISGGEALIRP